MTATPAPTESTVTDTGIDMPSSRTAIEQMSAADRLQLMRAPFAAADIGLLPRSVARDEDKSNKAKCTPDNPQVSADRLYCGGYHNRSLHLSYVGHAALTHRLLEVDPMWNWEPVAFDAAGAPYVDQNMGLWIRLTVQGVTRLGYGSADGKRSGDGVKEAIGDALRNAAMRFGAALDLWHKGDLSAPGALADANAAAEEGGRDWVAEANVATDADGIKKLWAEARAAGAPLAVLDGIIGVGTRMTKKAAGR